MTLLNSMQIAKCEELDVKVNLEKNKALHHQTIEATAITWIRSPLEYG